MRILTVGFPGVKKYSRGETGDLAQPTGLMSLTEARILKGLLDDRNGQPALA